MSQTLKQLYQSIRDQLEPVVMSTSQASAEADLILQGVLGIEASTIYSQGDAPMSVSQCDQVSRLLMQRIAKRIPLQYLLHEAHFFGLTFYVNPHVLIPRPETELLVEQALGFIRPGMCVLDVGTGPGTIALTLAHRLKEQNVQIVAVDASEFALKVARLNQKRLGTQVDIRNAGDLFNPIFDEQFDLIVSNPPYIDPILKSTLSPEVLWHEPDCALFPPGEDAYHFYRRLAKEGKSHLKANGSLMVEVGAGMGAHVESIFKAEGYTTRLLKDYSQLDRVVTASL